jgi:anti-sigma factor RsiW
MKNPAREKFLPLLSPYVDGELSPEERRQVEQHLANSEASAREVADLRAGDALMRHALEMQADQVDWKGFTDGVMSRLTPERLPLFERLKLTFSEMLTWQRGPLLAGFAGAAAAVLIAIPVTMRLATPDGYGAARLEVQTVAVDTQANVKPVVMETDDGDAVIWVVDGPEKEPDKAKAPDGAPDSKAAPDDATDKKGEL